jgi:flagellar protein FlgJ
MNAAASPPLGPTPMSPQEALTRQRIKDTAKAFEANFLSTAISGMFEGVKPDAPFGGGEGEDAFRSFLNEAMAKQIVHRGGVGLASTVEREMLHLQGLAPPPQGAASLSAPLKTPQPATYGRRP